MDRVPGLPPHASPPARRLATLATFRARGIPTQATISPLLPLADPRRSPAVSTPPAIESSWTTT